jgi:hypothetical protein
MKNNAVKYLSISLFVIACILGYLTYKLSSEKGLLNKIITQNEASLDSAKTINKNWVQKYAQVKKLNYEKDELLKERDETILSQTKIIAQLNSIHSEGKGSVEKDTVFIEEKKFVDKIVFTKTTPFYSYELNVWVNPSPFHKLDIYFKPITMDTYLTRNKKGLWSGYVKVQDELREYLSITDLNVFVEKDEYARVEKTPTRWDLGVGGNILTTPEVYLGFGVDLLIDVTHEFGYSYYLGIGHHEATYRYFFNVKR